jgi:integrase
VKVRVYQRKTPSGNFAYMVANCSETDENGKTKRRFDCYPDADQAKDAADKLAERLSKRQGKAASLTESQAVEWVASNERLKEFGVTVDRATSVVAECLKILPDLASFQAALKFFVARNREVTKKTVSDVVKELLKIKTGNGASARYMKDLKSRLERFAEDFKKNCCDVTTADIQAWMDNLGTGDDPLGPQSRKNYWTVLRTFFRFAVARGYASDNPVESVERIRVRGGDIEIFSPAEIGRLLDAAKNHYPDYVPCLAIGAFAGLRSAEIERLDWSDIDLKDRHIVVAASKAKTASRRIVPIHDNLAAWLADYANETGKVWKESSVLYYKRQYSVAAQTEMIADESKGVKAEKPVEWKANALRHSYVSYRFAQTGDAGRVSGEVGNTAKVIFRHYREMVKPAEAEKWFNVRPQQPANVVSISTGMSA